MPKAAKKKAAKKKAAKKAPKMTKARQEAAEATADTIN